jgi:hypothetical protein
MTDITIPPEALAAMRAKLPPFFSESMARAACLALLKAWPRSYSLAENDSAVIRDVAVIILPLPEKGES